MDLFLKKTILLIFACAVLAVPAFALLPIELIDNGVPRSRGIQTITLNGVQPAVWTNMPAALTELPGSRINIDLTHGLQVRIILNVTVVGNATARVGAQCSNDGGASWHFFDDVSEPNVLINTTGPKRSNWIDVIPACRGDVLMRVGGINGNGTLDPAFGLTLIEFQ